MQRDDALALIEIARTGIVPEVDARGFSEWFVAISDRNGLRKGLKLLDQQMRRTDQAVARFICSGGRGWLGGASAMRNSIDPA